MMEHIMAKKQTHAKKKTPPKKSTALVRQQPRPAIQVRDPQGLMPQPTAQLGPMALASEPTLMVAFIGTLKLTPTQVTALRRPVADDELDWKPTFKDGPPDMPYLSHNGYRDRLDAAFGLGQWGMMPTGAPREKDSVVYCPYALVVDGKPRIYAWGQQEYHPNNRQMTYGDALEGAKSNAIMRCGKELGIARELWDKKHIAALKRRLGPGGASSKGEDRRPPRGKDERPPVASRHAHQDEPITGNQYGRLLEVIKRTGRTKREVLKYLEAHYGLTAWDDVKTLKRHVYEDVYSAIERSGPLPEKAPVREADEILDADDIQWGVDNGRP